jgi:hypothetical protein
MLVRLVHPLGLDGHPPSEVLERTERTKDTSRRPLAHRVDSELAHRLTGDTHWVMAAVEARVAVERRLRATAAWAPYEP